MSVYDHGKLLPSHDPALVVRGLSEGLYKYLKESAMVQLKAPPGTPIYGREWRGKKDISRGHTRTRRARVVI